MAGENTGGSGCRRAPGCVPRHWRPLTPTPECPLGGRGRPRWSHQPPSPDSHSRPAGPHTHHFPTSGGPRCPHRLSQQLQVSGAEGVEKPPDAFKSRRMARSHDTTVHAVIRAPPSRTLPATPLIGQFARSRPLRPERQQLEVASLRRPCLSTGSESDL